MHLSPVALKTRPLLLTWTMIRASTPPSPRPQHPVSTEVRRIQSDLLCSDPVRSQKLCMKRVRPRGTGPCLHFYIGFQIILKSCTCASCPAGGSVVPVQHHSRQPAAGAGGHRCQPSPHDHSFARQGVRLLPAPPLTVKCSGSFS